LDDLRCGGVHEMNLRNELLQTHDEGFVSCSRNLTSTKQAVGPEEAPVTLSDVARVAGVSKMTVSRVLNGHPRVSAEKVDRVNAAISKLHYLPNEHAIKLRRGKGKGSPNGVIQMPVLLEEKSARQWRPLDEVLRSPVPTSERTLSEDEYAKLRTLLFFLNENLEQLASIIR
jgi:transcriptional regulator with XRE-family HTH domain